MSMTTDQLIERTRQLLAEQDSTGGIYTDADILELLNQGVRNIFDEVWALPFEETGTVSASSAVLTLTTDWARIEKIRVDGTDRYLTPKKFSERSLLSGEGEPAEYCPDYLDSSGDAEIRVIREPSADTDLVVTGWKYPSVLDTAAAPISGSDVPPDWHARFHAAPAYWAASVLLNMDNLPEESAFQERRFYGFIEEYRRFLLLRFPHRLSRTEAVEVEGM